MEVPASEVGEVIQALLEATFYDVEYRDPADRNGPVDGRIEHFLDLNDDLTDDNGTYLPVDPEADRDATWQALVQVVDRADPVVVTAHADGKIDVAEFAITWEGQAPEARRSAAHRLELPPPRREEWMGSDLRMAVARAGAVVNLVRATHEGRQSRYFTCPYCSRRTAPEHGGGVCHGCMSEHLGVVY